MTNSLKAIARKSFLYPTVQRWRTRRRLRTEVRDWENAGRSGPAPILIKHKTVRDYGQRYGARVLVETGTFLGDMVEAQRGGFDRVYSIELHPKLAADAQKRFAAAPNVTIVQGDSATALPKVLAEIKQRTLFWLDGHWSEGITARGNKDTPIVAELAAIAHTGARDSVILIDDARCFTGEGDYPTIEALRQETARHWDHVDFEVAEDIIRITPRSAA